MSIVAGIIFAAVGAVLGTVLANLLIVVVGMSFLSDVVSWLPFPLDLAALLLLAPQWIATWIGLLVITVVILVLVLIGYVIASVGTTLPTAPGAPGARATTGPIERAGRGGLVGLNAGLNWALLVSLLAVLPGGALVSFLLALLGWLACIPAVSASGAYQVALSYGCLFLPMALPLNLLGLLVIALNSVGVLFGAPGFTLLAFWPRATLVVYGGWVHGCPRTEYNLSNFTMAHGDMAPATPWLDPGPVWPFCGTGSRTRFDTMLGMLPHEGGHTLNAGAFGWVYTLIGFVDEWTVMMTNAYAELCAHGPLRGWGNNWVDMWVGTGPGANANAIAAVTIPAAAGVVEVAPFTTVGSPPVARPHVVCERNRNVTLDSSPSMDTDGPMPLGRLWRLPRAPAGSAAAIATPNGTALSFVPDVGGDYTVELLVTDGADGGVSPGDSGALRIGLDVLEAIIEAPAGPHAAGVQVTLDSAASEVPNIGSAGIGLREWEVVSTPAGAPAPAITDTGVTFDYTPADPGTHVVRLTITREYDPRSGPPAVALSDSATIELEVD